MEKRETAIPGALVIQADVHRDDRGYVRETFSYRQFGNLGVNGQLFLQGSESVSHLMTLRGLHYQLKRPQAKLCWVASGKVLDVIADIRVGSPTYSTVVLTHLEAGSGRAVYVPRGCAHGFLALQEGTVFQYLCDADYDPHDQFGVIWDDPRLSIAWNVLRPILSPKDASLRQLNQIPDSELPRYIK